MARHIANKILWHIDDNVLAHATDVSFEASRDAVEVTARTDDDFAEFEPGQVINMSGSCEAFLDWDPSEGDNYQRLWDAMVNQELIDFEISSGESGHKKHTGKAYITNLSGFGSSGDGAQFTIEWQGTGKQELEDVET